MSDTTESVQVGILKVKCTLNIKHLSILCQGSAVSLEATQLVTDAGSRHGPDLECANIVFSLSQQRGWPGHKPYGGTQRKQSVTERKGESVKTVEAGKQEAGTDLSSWPVFLYFQRRNSVSGRIMGTCGWQRDWQGYKILDQSCFEHQRG